MRPLLAPAADGRPAETRTADGCDDSPRRASDAAAMGDAASPMPARAQTPRHMTPTQVLSGRRRPAHRGTSERSAPVDSTPGQEGSGRASGSADGALLSEEMHKVLNL